MKRLQEIVVAMLALLIAPLRTTEELKNIVRDGGFVDYWREYAWNDYCRPNGHADFSCN